MEGMLSHAREHDAPNLVLRWHDKNPLPRRLLRARRPPRTSLNTPPWWTTGPEDQPFDFSGHLRQLVADVAVRCDAFQHIQIERLLIAVTAARTRHDHGLQARITPMRFARGGLFRRRRGVTYQVQRYFLDDTELLYLITFCLPRFLDQDFDGKLITLFHELYHIGPAFDGDVRRHDGRYEIHSHSRCAYDRRMAALAREYLASKPDPALHDFLRLNFDQLQHRHGAIAGIVVPRPKVIPVVLLRTDSVPSRSGFPA